MPNLDSLPTEIVEKIVTKLDLESIKALRGVCQNLRAKSSGPRFRSFLAIIPIDLGEQNLNTLNSIASHPELSGAVTKLKVTGFLNGPTRANSSQSVGRWLRFQIAASDARKVSDGKFLLAPILKKRSGLSAIEIDSTCYYDKENRILPASSRMAKGMFRLASKVFQTVLVAVLTSGIALRTLDLCFDCLGYAVPLDRMTSGVEEVIPNWMDHSLASVQSFSISFTTSKSSKNVILQSDNKVLEAVEPFIGKLVKLLGLMPDLKVLKLELYTLPRPGSDAGLDLLFAHLAHSLRYPNLRSCTFRGISTTSEALCQWLRNHPNLEFLALDTWIQQPVLDQIKIMPRLQEAITVINIIDSPGFFILADYPNIRIM